MCGVPQLTGGEIMTRTFSAAKTDDPELKIKYLVHPVMPGWLLA